MLHITDTAMLRATARFQPDGTPNSPARAHRLELLRMRRQDRKARIAKFSRALAARVQAAAAAMPGAAPWRLAPR